MSLSANNCIENNIEDDKMDTDTHSLSQRRHSADRGSARVHPYAGRNGRRGSLQVYMEGITTTELRHNHKRRNSTTVLDGKENEISDIDMVDAEPRVRNRYTQRRGALAGDELAELANFLQQCSQQKRRSSSEVSDTSLECSLDSSLTTYHPRCAPS
eukprot:m.20773 g.20773  ORF g.20773 m.20773 type:complete len:157 (-) comp6947_c0_seq1:225-695(-)